MAKQDLNEVEDAYNKAGFRTVYRDEESISFAKKAPIVVVDPRGRTRTTPEVITTRPPRANPAPKGSPAPKK